MAERITLGGGLVRLDPMVIGDVDALVVAATEERSSYGLTRVPGDAGSMLAYVSGVLEDEAAGAALPFTIRRMDDGRVVGSSRFLDLETWPMFADRRSAAGVPVPSVAEIGATWLAASVQRTGVNTECKMLMLTHAFEAWQVERVSFKTDARNQRSRAAIERIGATLEGVRRAHMPGFDGAIRDSAYFSIVRDEWPGIKASLRRRLSTPDR